MKPGDLVDVVAPSWGVPKATLPRVRALLEGLGLRARFPEDILGKDLLCANSKDKRIEFFLRALQAPDSGAIWALRGGHGAADLLSSLDKIRPKRNKLFVGLSDITSLHMYLNQKWNWATIHGPNLNRLESQPPVVKYVNELKKVIFGQLKEVEFSHLTPLNAPAMEKRQVEGRVFGGNLVVCSSLIGTPYMKAAENRILFFEEVGERGYRLDRLFLQWEQAGLFRGVKAIVFGDVTEGQDPDGKDLTGKVLVKFADGQTIPVLRGIRCGHGHIQRPVPLWTRARLQLGLKPKLVCETGAR